MLWFIAAAENLVDVHMVIWSRLFLSHPDQLRSAGVMCRPKSGSCDLPEYCDGKSESCPANFFLMDGSSCESGKAYCYTGMCLTLDQQCVSLWGKGNVSQVIFYHVQW